MTPLEMMVTDLNSEYLGIPRLSLMENAGRSLAQQISIIYETLISDSVNQEPCKVVIVAGSGGNGGDGFVAARHLLNKGFKVEIIMLIHPLRINSAETRTNWEVLENMRPYMGHFKVHEITDSSQLKYFFDDIKADILVDAMLGTGVKGILKEPFRSAVEIINGHDSLIVAVDVPTGLDPLSGEVMDRAVMADHTVTFHRAKAGLIKGAPEYVGELIVCDIGIPLEAEIFLGKGDLLRIKKRDKNSHKGLNGRLLVVGGSKDYSGAPAFAGISALSVGADIAVIACPESAKSSIKSYSPDLIVKPMEGEFINLSMVDSILKLSEDAGCVLLGCGVGMEPETGEALNLVVEKIENPLVLDADALKLVKKDLVKEKENLIITPHAAEFKAFFGDNTPVMLRDLREKISAFQSLSHQIKGTLLFKGKHDLIVQGNKFRLNKTGSPGMTVGGTGDCLAGVVSAFMAQGHSSFDAAGLGAFINGRAGELAEGRYGYNFTASQMIKFLSEALKSDF
jgi:hydroxyethylthiazole kinase-like uncharacterized protein yjeF